jgi:hypothetical protein
MRIITICLAIILPITVLIGTLVISLNMPGPASPTRIGKLLQWSLWLITWLGIPFLSCGPLMNVLHNVGHVRPASAGPNHALVSGPHNL